MKFGFYLMNKKGYATLVEFARRFGAAAVGGVVAGRDAHLVDDYYDRMQSYCVETGIAFFDRQDARLLQVDYAFAVGWRWLIECPFPLIVTHDSLLPRYRGFAPLVSALINGEPTVGVSALHAAADYDRGDLIAQQEMSIQYPLKIAEAIDRVIPLFSTLLVAIAELLLRGEVLPARRQDEALASYSLWRDDEDYRIDWSRSATEIQRFVDAVGTPYRGALTAYDGQLIRVHDVVVVEDVRIENRQPGKVIFLDEDMPVVVCGKGLAKITRAIDATTDTPWVRPIKFRVRVV